MSNWRHQALHAGAFLQVTNRDFSLFLWQNPSYMRASAKSKMGYLPDFQYMNKITVEPEKADQFVQAPPDVLYTYHVWDALLKKEFTPRKILVDEFRDFLSYAEEWKPTYWPNAPQSYVEFYEKTWPILHTVVDPDLIPLDVQRAFVGWKNYFLEGPAINALQPKKSVVQAFLTLHPNYERPLWRNLVDKETPNYLKSLHIGDDEQVLPAGEITAFLRVGIYNWLHP